MEIDELYQEIILDHYKHPRNFKKLSEAEAMIDEENPTCGDHIKLTAKVEQGKLSEVKIDCAGCAICTASGSIMSELMLNKPVSAIEKFATEFMATMRGEKDLSDEVMGDLVALRGVKNYPLRVKCATMPWHALLMAMKKLGV